MNAHIEQIDLRADGAARAYVKDEIVSVAFAHADGQMQSSVGINRYRAGDALITGGNGDTWSVSRDRFDDRYEATAERGKFRARRKEVLAKQIGVNFSVARSTGGDVLQGAAGDWLLQYAPGDFGIVDVVRFASVYRVVYCICEPKPAAQMRPFLEVVSQKMAVLRGTLRTQSPQ